jgi:hypothetical protein
MGPADGSPKMWRLTCPATAMSTTRCVAPAASVPIDPRVRP